MAWENAKYEYTSSGFFVIKNFLTSSEVDSLLVECSNIVENMNPPDHCSIFHTAKDQDRDDYFLNSGDNISFFFEKDSVDKNGHLIVDKNKSLNKIGHALHWENPVYKNITFSDKVKDLLKHLDYQDPVIVQSMFIFKHPEIGGIGILYWSLFHIWSQHLIGPSVHRWRQLIISDCNHRIPFWESSRNMQVFVSDFMEIFTPHQDSTFLYTEPPSAIGLWFPLVDVTLDNGCLWFIPGSHKGEIYQRYIRNPEGKPRLVLTGDIPKFSDEEYVPVLAKKGDCVIIHGSVIHKSGKNLTGESRSVYTFHAVENKDVKYSKENWLQPTENLPFPSLYSV